MNAIKLPVRIEKGIGSLGEWGVMDDDNVTICRTGAREYLASTIALSLNSHDALVDALGFYALEPSECRNRLNPDLPGTRNDWNAEIGHDSGRAARAALAKVEEFKKTS